MSTAIFKSVQSEDNGYIRLSEAGEIVRALSDISHSEDDAKLKARSMLSVGARLFGPDTDAQMLLYTQLTRKPAPRLAGRVWCGPVFERIEPRSNEIVQKLLDTCGPGLYPSVPESAEQTGRPIVVHFREDSDPNWFHNSFVPGILQPKGWTDCLTALWSASPLRVISLNVFRSGGQPEFNAEDRRRISLVVRAAAPLMDRAMFRNPVVGTAKLTPAQKTVLARLLRGDSEKQIARALSRSEHTVHTHIKSLHETFQVASRGELLAKFIDQRLVRDLEEGNPR
jgi:DNA-binding CsgD family transcriptional regulator